MADLLRSRWPAPARSALLLATLMSSVSCGLFTGPSKSVAGTWRAPGIGHSGNYYELSLTQSGDRISGVACGSDGGFLLFRDAPVSSEYPRVVFIAPGGATFSGKFEEDRDQIAGDFGTSGIPLRFIRSEGGQCAGARPIGDVFHQS